jgi:hypothetical protein
MPTQTADKIPIQPFLKFIDHYLIGALTHALVFKDRRRRHIPRNDSR